MNPSRLRLNRSRQSWIRRSLTALLLGCWLVIAAPASAGPVDWQEVPAGPEGRQWWDAGSLRLNRQGNLTVLSRFQPAAPEAEAENQQADGRPARPPASSLYVMELDCGQNLYRDTSINGLPQWGSSWQAAGNDGLIEATIVAACAAGANLLAGF